MAKSKAKLGSIDNPITSEHLANILEEEKHWFTVTEADIKDDFCNYNYEITQGVGLGRIHKVDGKSSGMIIDKDMNNAFANLNVHFAVMDEVFKHSGIEIDNIDNFHSHELTGLYQVTGFVIKGSEENETVFLRGNKYVSSLGGRAKIEFPKTFLDNLSSYKWHNELKTAVDAARLEVQLYDGGKYTSPEVEEPKEKTKLKQPKLPFGSKDPSDGENTADGEEGNSYEHDDLSDFDNASV